MIDCLVARPPLRVGAGVNDCAWASSAVVTQLCLFDPLVVVELTTLATYRDIKMTPRSPQGFGATSRCKLYRRQGHRKVRLNTNPKFTLRLLDATSGLTASIRLCVRDFSNGFDRRADGLSFDCWLMTDHLGLSNLANPRYISPRQGGNKR